MTFLSKTRFSVFLGAVLALTGAGCQSAGRTSAVLPGAPGSVPAGSVATSSSGGENLCDHPYYPLRLGYTAKFTNRYPGGSGTYDMSVTDRENQRIIFKIAFSGGTTATQSFSCTDGDLHATGYVDFASAAAGQRTSVETRRAEGVVIPRDVHVGSDWDTKFDIVIHSQNPTLIKAGMGDMSGTVAVHHKVLDEESVTVPAGTFTALKVQTETQVQFSARGTALGAAGAPPMISNEWWVRGKGLVKTTTGEHGDVISEATEIIVP